MNNPRRQIGVQIADQEDGFENADNDNPQRYGYVRKLKNKSHEEGNRHVPKLNRDDVANTITSMVVELPDINEAATLVTDDKVLVGYKTDADNTKQASEQIKRTAMAAVPRFFDVYVSDKDGIIENIARFQNMQTTNRNAEALLDETIKQMDKSS